MKKRTYGITGASGHVGHYIVEDLLSKGHTVRALSRDESHLTRLIEMGAEPWIGQPEDEEYLCKAFTDCDAVFAMIPPHLKARNLREYQNDVGRAQAHAIEKSGVPYVINLSSLGAEYAEKVGPVRGLHDQEERLNAIEGAHVLHLRPTYFFENLFYTARMIRRMGIMGTPIRGDIPIPMIATRDIASVATQRLLALDWTGHPITELLGQRDLTYNEIARLMGEHLHQDSFKYVEVPYEAAKKAMIDIGLSEDAADNLNELYHAFNEGLIHTNEGRNPDNTTATRIEDFMPDFVQAVAA